MTFDCDGCESRSDYRDFGIGVLGPRRTDGYRRYCRACCRPKVAFHDVYWDGKPEENLADDPMTGKPRVFSSKAEKAAYLRDRGLMEAGDRVHGSPLMVSQQEQPRPDTRHEVKMALKKVKEMGQDVRRQKYLKILKEGRRYA